MKQDYLRVLVVLAISLIVGLIVGQVFFCLFVGLLIYVFWMFRALRKLSRSMNLKKELEVQELPGLIDDISKQYKDLRKRHKSRKKNLAKYLKRFKETTKALPDGIVILGENDEIEWANHNAEEYLGIRHVQDIGQRIVNLIRNPSLISFLRNKRGAAYEGETSLQMVSPVNKDVFLELRIVSFGEAEKLLVVRDITKIFRINKMRTDFIANASHELRTPLTVISGYLESFEDDFSKGDFESEKLRIRHMREQTERMRRLIEDLLKLSSLETTEELDHAEPVRIPDLIYHIVDAARALGGDLRHEFVLDVDESLWIEGDRNQIYSAISNVVFNAVQHTPDRGKITIKWFMRGKQGIFEVSDTGEGISQDQIPRITERFYRVDKGRSRDKGGTGLGLAIVKHILAKHKSRLEVESKLGQGSTFRFMFPDSLIIKKDVIGQQEVSPGGFVENHS